MTDWLGSLYRDCWPSRYRVKTRRADVIGYGDGAQATDALQAIRVNRADYDGVKRGTRAPRLFDHDGYRPITQPRSKTRRAA